MMIPLLLLPGLTGPAIQLVSSNCSDELNHTKSGLTHERRFHILVHRHTGKTPTFLDD